MPVNEKITIDESQVIQAIENIIKKLDTGESKVEQFSKAMNKNMADAGKGTMSLDGATDKLVESLDDVVKKEEALTKSTTSASSALKGAASDISIFGVNIGQTVTQLQSKITALRGVQGALSATSKGFNILKVAIAGTGIGLLLVVLGSLVAFFTRTQKGIDLTSRAFNVLGSVVGNITDRMSKLGGALIELFKGNFKAAIDQATSAVTGLGAEILKDARAVDELTKRTQALRDASRDLSVEEAKTRQIIEEKRFQSKDLALSEKQRADLLKEVQVLETNIGQKRIALAQENLDIIKETNAVNESLAGDLDKQAEAEIALANARSEIDRNNRRIFQEEQTLRQQAQAEYKAQRDAAAKAAEEERKQVEQLTKAYEDMISTINDRIADAELDKLTGEDRLRAERDLALSEIDILETKAKAAATAAGVAFEAEKQFYVLRAQAQEEFENKIKEGRGNSSIAPKLDDAGIKAEAEKVAIELPKTIQEIIEKDTARKNPFDALKDKLVEALGIDANELGPLLDGLDIVKDAILGNIEDQLSANEKLLDSIREQTNTVQSELEKQQDLKEQGFANDTSLNKMRLAELQKEEKKALEEQKKLQKQKAAIETVEQVGSLITASANIFQAFSAIPIVGVPLAIAAIATMFGTFIATKARASAASRAFKGGPLANYLAGERNTDFISPGGPSDVIGRGDGIPIGNTGVVVGGDEFLIAEGPAKEHTGFLRKLNNGKYKGMNLEKMISGLPGLPNHGAAVVRFQSRQLKIDKAESEMRTAMQYAAIRDGVTHAIEKQTGDLIQYWSKKKERAPFSKEGYMEWNDNNFEIVKKIL